MKPSRTAAVLALVLLPILGLMGYASAFTVRETQQALVLQFGDPQRVVAQPGLHFRLPFIQQVKYIDARLLSFDAQEEEITAADKKRLIVDAYARYRIAKPLLFYKTVRDERTAQARLAPIVNSSLREVLADVDLQAVLSAERAELMQRITRLTDDEAAAIGVDVVDVRITRADLPKANSQAIYERMRAERDREAREIRARGAEESQRIKADADRQKAVLLAKAEKTADITRGQGDAKRFQIYADAARRDPEFFAFYRTMQAYRTALGDDSTTLVLSPEGNDFLDYFGDIDGRTAAPAAKQPPAPKPEGPMSDASGVAAGRTAM